MTQISFKKPSRFILPGVTGVIMPLAQWGVEVSDHVVASNDPQF